ncbi:hypothetical protein NYT34_10005 [Staphylococcus aureus]|nr:hypothetical protein [Staphylococcus aureus]
MKKLLTLTGIVAPLAVLFLIYSFYELNKKEYYYGFVDDKKEIESLKDENGDVINDYNLTKNDKKIERNKWVKVTYTKKKE